MTKIPNRYTLRRQIASFSVFISSLTPFVFGADPTPVDPKPDGETVVLSPFVVDTSKDQGYRATSTLAGSRINTSLKDVANAITVVTKDFFNDVAAVDVNDILSYTPGTEGFGQHVDNENVLNAPEDFSGEHRQTSNRIRGLSAADISRDYFATLAGKIGFDTYNVDEVTINRGPNSVLFGQGSASGLINYSPQLANLQKNSTEITYRFGSFNDQRATFNSNIVAKSGVLAVRVAGVWNDRGFKQQPAYDRDTRAYVATTYQPFLKTTIRASYEHVDRSLREANSFTPADYVTPWIQAGRPTLDLSTSPLPLDQIDVVYYNKNGSIEGAFQGRTTTEGADRFKPVQPNGFYIPGFHDNKLVNFETSNFYPRTDEGKYDVFEASLDQEILPNLNLNLAYVNETYHDLAKGDFWTSLFSLRVDNVTKFQNGDVNPHFGELYMDANGGLARWPRNDKNEVGRATLNYNLDLQKYNKWLGHYSLTGFMESRKWSIWYANQDWHPVDDPNYQKVYYRYYLGGSATTPITSLPGVAGAVKDVPELHYDSVSGEWVPGTLTTKLVNGRIQEDINRLQSRAFVGQAYLLDEMIVGTVGVRHDLNTNINRGVLGDATHQSLPDQFSDPATAAGQTVSYGVVAHPLKWLSLHYSKSENFKPAAGTIDLFKNPTPSPTGAGKDYGFSVNLFDDKLNVKVNWFDMSQKNDFPGQIVRILAQWQLPFAEFGVIKPLVEQQLHLPYKSYDPSANPILWGDGRLEYGSYTADILAKGVEVEMTYNVTKNWRIMANITKQEAVRSNIATPLGAIIEERLAYWKSIPGLLTTLSTTNPWGVAWTGQDAYNSVLLPYLQYKSGEGQPTSELSKYRFNAITNYQFSAGKLKGFSVGGGVRIADRPVVGNPYIYENIGGQTVPTGLDLAHPYLGDRPVSLDAWVGYTRKVFNNKYVLTLQLNCRDLTSNGGFQVISAAGPDANGARVDETYRLKQPRTFYLTTKLEY